MGIFFVTPWRTRQWQFQIAEKTEYFWFVCLKNQGKLWQAQTQSADSSVNRNNNFIVLFCVNWYQSGPRGLGRAPGTDTQTDISTDLNRKDTLSEINTIKRSRFWVFLFVAAIQRKNIPNTTWVKINIFYELYFAAFKQCIESCLHILDAMSQHVYSDLTPCHTLPHFVYFPLEVWCY